MKCQLCNEDVEIVLIRKKNKNMYFRVKEDLKLYITCPIFIREKELLKVIEENKLSLEKMYIKQRDKVLPPNIQMYLGEKYQVVYDETKEDVVIDKLQNIIYIKDEDNLDDFLMQECDRVFKEEVDKCKMCFRKLPDFTLKKRNMRTRWGVCNRRSLTITLNTELITKDIYLIDYVVIHEMCHFFEGNHGKAFWNLVSQAYPRYKEARKKLKE